MKEAFALGWSRLEVDPDFTPVSPSGGEPASEPETSQRPTQQRAQHLSQYIAMEICVGSPAESSPDQQHLESPPTQQQQQQRQQQQEQQEQHCESSMSSGSIDLRRLISAVRARQARRGVGGGGNLTLTQSVGPIRTGPITSEARPPS